MAMKKKGWKRRSFLQLAGAGVPAFRLLQEDTAEASAEEPKTGAGKSTTKFSSVDLGDYFNASPSDFGPRSRAKPFSRDGLIRTPLGKQKLRGIPFALAPAGKHQSDRQKQWLALSRKSSAWTTPAVEIPLSQKATYVCLAQFCDWIRTPVHDGIVHTPFAGSDELKKLGQLLAQVIFVREDGKEHVFPIRRRFEVYSPSVPWYDEAFASVPHYQYVYAEQAGTGRYRRNRVSTNRPKWPLVWLCALANPEPELSLKALRIQATSEDLLLVCGLTLFRGHKNPLRHEALQLYRLTLPEASAEDTERWKLDVDLGVIAKSYVLDPFQPAGWLSEPEKGLGRFAKRAKDSPYLYAELSASTEATLSVHDTETGKHYSFDLGAFDPEEAAAGKQPHARSGGMRIELLEPQKVWLHGRVLDSGTRRPTPVRLGFRSQQGRYIPPYGHCSANDIGMGQYYSPDLRMGDDCFAYVDGTFQIELPVGEVYLEMTKGFEYEPVRRAVTIQPGQRELELEITRFTDLRSRGWLTADTHVHYLSPTTAVLEGQAEGLNLVHILAVQWSNLFSNVGDFSTGPVTSRDGETLITMGTENRHHIMGHLGLLGAKGEPVFPMSAGGPHEGAIGTPLWSSLSDWAELCRQREGLVVAAHVPYSNGELAAEVVRGKIDAVELAPWTEQRPGGFDLHFYDWYHCLNAGYRLPAVGGSDKMGTYVPVGANRTYAYLGQGEVNFDNWAQAVRRGNTFSTTGPLLLFSVDGHRPGEEIRLKAGGGTLEVRVEARSFVPFERVEVVYNGLVVASREAREGTREMAWSERVRVSGPGWLAARCASRLSWPPWPADLAFSVAAHTSPVYLLVPGQELLAASSAGYLLKLIDGAQSYVENLATRPDPERLARVLKVFEEARSQLRGRMSRHGISS